MGARGDDVVQVAREALERLPAGAAASRARLMAMIAAAILLAGGSEQARELGAEALAVARASGDGNALGEVLITAHWACLDPLNLDRRLDWAQEACDLGERLHNPVVLAQALRMLGQDRLESGDLSGASAAFDRSDRIAGELDAPFLRMFDPAGRGHAGRTGRTPRRGRATRRRLPRARAPHRRPSAVLRRGGRHRAHRARAVGRRCCEPEGAGRSARAGSPRSAPPSRCSTPAWEKRTKGARHLRHFTEADFANLPRIIHWFPGMVMLADAATWLRDADAAARIRELLEPVSGRTPWNAFTALWPIDIALAQLSVVLGRARPRPRVSRCRRADLRAQRPRRPPGAGRAVPGVGAARRGEAVDAGSALGRGGRLAVRRCRAGGAPDGARGLAWRPESQRPSGKPCKQAQSEGSRFDSWRGHLQTGALVTRSSPDRQAPRAGSSYALGCPACSRSSTASSWTSPRRRSPSPTTACCAATASSRSCASTAAARSAIEEHLDRMARSAATPAPAVRRRRRARRRAGAAGGRRAPATRCCASSSPAAGGGSGCSRRCPSARRRSRCRRSRTRRRACSTASSRSPTPRTCSRPAWRASRAPTRRCSSRRTGACSRARRRRSSTSSTARCTRRR